MAGSSGLVEFNIQNAEDEILDLKRFWKDLSWWERDDSINTSLGSINIMLLAELSPDQKQRANAIQGTCKELWDSNQRPSKIRTIFGLLPNEHWKPNFRACMQIVMNVPEEELIALGKYLNIKEIDALSENTSDLFDLYMKLGQNSTQAMFYAFRNYLGKRWRLK